MDLITNRTQDDVNRVLYLRNMIISSGWSSLSETEQNEYTIGPVIGEYRDSDLNRVGAAVASLAALLISYGYPVTVSAKTDWTAADVPRAAQMTTYLSNIAALKAAFYGTQEIPSSMTGFDHEAANNVEKLLLEIETLIDNMTSQFLYSGGFYSGTDHQIQILTGVT